MVRTGKYIALLGGHLALMAAIAGAVAARRYGEQAYLASAVGATLIWLVGSIALLSISAPQTHAGRLNGALVAMLVRMTIPLAVMVYLSRTNHPLIAVGVGGLIVFHYLAALVVETLLAMRIVASAKPATIAVESK